MKSKKWLNLAIFIIILIISWVVIYLWTNKNPSLVSEKWMESHTNSTKKEYLHTNPTRISKNDYIKWEFISNDIAAIYPRREALVRDILVDIWDEVRVWDTLAILFNPWVQGEWQSKINIKNTVVSSKNNLLIEVKNVKEAKIAELEQKVIEREITLEEVIKNFDIKISQVGDNETSWSEYQVQLNTLENLKKNLSNAQATQEELLIESKNNIKQKEDLLDAKITEVYNKIIPILYIGNEKDTDYTNINSGDFSDYLWAKNSQWINEFITLLKKYQNNKEILSIDDNYSSLIEINNNLISVLYNTISSIEITEAIIASHIASLNSLQSVLISQKEILDDAQTTYNLLILTQNEKIENIEIQIITKENELKLLGTKNIAIWSEKSLLVSKLKAEIDTLIKSKELLIASENRNIVGLENEINIARADLNSEAIKSWDYKIISPFSWIISKRGIEIWEMIKPSMEAFRLTDVETTLSKITKKEVKFLIPESLKENITIGKPITFSLGDNESKSYTGSIYRISPEVDEQTLSIIVQAKVNDTISLPNKSTLRVNIETQEEIYKLPSSTIYNKEERKIIYYKKENWKLWVRDINIVSEDWEYSLVTGNIDENLQVVTTPIFIK
jgi:hypothetical protein